MKTKPSKANADFDRKAGFASWPGQVWTWFGSRVRPWTFWLIPIRRVHTALNGIKPQQLQYVVTQPMDTNGSLEIKLRIYDNHSR